MTAPHTLIADDDPFVRESLRDILEHAGFVALEAGDGRTALGLLEQEPVDLLLLDLELPRMTGLQVLRHIAERQLDIPVVIISGKGSILTAVETMKLGAIDFIEKPLDAERTLGTIRSALARVQQRQARRRTADEVLARYGMVGTSPAIQEVYRTIDRAAATRARVLIAGESGTGKEMVAAAIHRLSRLRGPFVAVNCAAIPETLIESELFGHTPGAFTGALRARRGSLDEAHEGTLFLDEVGDMSLMTQAKVLRALETRTFRLVGGEEDISSDFRLIAATHRELRDEVDRGNFREDLFYRLSVVTLVVPPLRQRRADIGELAAHFLRQHRERNGLPPAELTPSAVTALVHGAWPGNVRQLSNVIESLSVLQPGRAIDGRDVRGALRRGPAGDPDTGAETLRGARVQFEREFISAALANHQGRIQDTAEALGINRSHLWKKIRALQLRHAGPAAGELSG